VVHKDEYLLDVEDCIVICELAGGVLANALIRIISAVLKLLDTKRLIPTQLKKKIDQQEWELLKVEYASVQVQVGKGKFGNCGFYYWIPNVPLLTDDGALSWFSYSSRKISRLL
jgi:hypothetical protein